MLSIRAPPPMHCITFDYYGKEKSLAIRLQKTVWCCQKLTTLTFFEYIQNFHCVLTLVILEKDLTVINVSGIYGAGDTWGAKEKQLLYRRKIQQNHRSSFKGHIWSSDYAWNTCVYFRISCSTLAVRTKILFSWPVLRLYLKYEIQLIHEISLRYSSKASKWRISTFCTEQKIMF